MSAGIFASVFVGVGAAVVFLLLIMRRRSGGFKASVAKITAELTAKNFAVPTAPVSDSAIIADLGIQWQDHFDMRDQTWKTLTNSALLFVGIVGLEIYKGTPHVVMIAGYSALILLSLMGFFVAVHHRRIQQKIKFPIITRYEVLLGLTPAFEDVLERHGAKGLSTSTFIVVAHAALCVIAALLLAMKLYVAVNACMDGGVTCFLDLGAVSEGDDPPAPIRLPAQD